MLPGPALIQADNDYRNANVDQKVQQYVAECGVDSAELDKAFIMAIEIGSSFLMSVQIFQSLYFQLQV